MAIIAALTSVAFWSDDEDEDENVMIPSIQRKFIRSKSNIMSIEENRFINLFRINKQTFLYILNQYKKYNPSYSGMDPSIKIAATLTFLAHGSYHLAVGQDFVIGMDQSTISKVMDEMLNFMESTMCEKFIKFDMNEDEKRKSKKYFQSIGGIPGVIGCVDGTHIKIIRPSKDEHLFDNNRGYYSLNTMIICNFQKKIIAVDPRYSGSNHDSYVWWMSTIRNRLREQRANNPSNSWLVGDCDYPLEPWLMTPYKTAYANTPEAKYNNMHAICRNLIKHVITILKTRFRCILSTRQLDYSPEKVARIINVCCMLHNLCIDQNILMDTDTSDPTVYDTEDIYETIMDSGSGSTIIAEQIRNNIKNKLQET